MFKQKEIVVILSIVVGLSYFQNAFSMQVGAEKSVILDVNHRRLISRADLTYNKPVARREEGLPVGNGRMGSLVWTTTTSLRLQINRVDVFPSNCATNSFPERHSDYCGGCGFVDVDFVDYGEDVFSSEQTRQHLSCYEGLVTLVGNGVDARVLAWHEQDVMALRISDRRGQLAAIRINLRMLRPAVVKRRSHSATSRLAYRDDRIILTQKFTEADYYCGSAVTVGVVGRNTKVKLSNDQELRLVAEQGNGSFTIFIASAASFDPEEDIAASALWQLQAAAAKGYAGLARSNEQ